MWEKEGWRTRETDRPEPVGLWHLNRKLDHILEGQAFIIEGQKLMQEALQPVADAIAAIATEEGEVAAAVQALVDKTDNGQVVVKSDVDVLVAALGSVGDKLKGVVAAAQAADEAQVPDPTLPPDDTAPVVTDPVVPPVADPVPAPAEPAPVEATTPAPAVSEPDPTPPVTDPSQSADVLAAPAVEIPPLAAP